MKAPGVEGYVDGAADHADARASTKFCGERLPRRTCWREGSNVTCLPYIMVLGEMKCGTTSMYKMLSSYPQVPAARQGEALLLEPVAARDRVVVRVQLRDRDDGRGDGGRRGDARRVADDLLDVRAGGGVAQEVDARGEAVGDAAGPRAARVLALADQGTTSSPRAAATRD